MVSVDHRYRAQAGSQLLGSAQRQSACHMQSEAFRRDRTRFPHQSREVGEAPAISVWGVRLNRSPASLRETDTSFLNVPPCYSAGLSRKCAVGSPARSIKSTSGARRNHNRTTERSAVDFAERQAGVTRTGHNERRLRSEGNSGGVRLGAHTEFLRSV